MMNDLPLVSVIVPFYNAEKYIVRCACSLFEQTLLNVEFIFVNDCSTDLTVETLSSLVNKYPNREPLVKIISHETNKGVAVARNTGLYHATGQYIAYVDADDWVEKEMMAELYGKAKADDADVVGCNWLLSFQDKERKMWQPVAKTPRECILLMMRGTMKWNLWLFIVKKDLYDRNNIHCIPTLNIGEDLMLMVKLLSFARRVSFVDKPFYHYVKSNSDSLTQSMTEKEIDQITGNVQEIEDFLRYNYGDEYNIEILFLKLNIKLPLLITDHREWYEKWMHWYPETNKYVMSNRNLSLRIRLIQYAAVKRQFWFLRLYYWGIVKCICGFIYR